MIDRRYGEYVPVCDGCDEELEPRTTFYDAVDEAKAAGWEYNPAFESNLCPACQKKIWGGS